MMDLSKTNSPSTLTISDNLNLDNLSVPNIPDDIVFPNELNNYLRQQVQYLTHENGMLRKNLSDAEFRLNKHETTIQNLTNEIDKEKSESSSEMTVAHFTSNKIVELSKKLREKNSEVESYKTKCSKLQSYIASLKDSKDDDVPEKPDIQKPKDELEVQIKVLEEKLSTANTKLYDSKNANLQLKNELKLANKLLQQEIGDNFQLLASSGNSGWRGRAQVICNLQQKNNELKERLKSYDLGEKVSSISGNSFHKNEIAMKTEKRIELLTKSNTDLLNKLEDTKRKLDTSRARAKMLEAECSSLRTKFNTVTEQNEKDLQLVTSLSAQKSQYQEVLADSLKQKQTQIETLEAEIRNMNNNISKQNCQIENLQDRLDKKHDEIKVLKMQKHCDGSPNTENFVDNTKLLELQTERSKLLHLLNATSNRLEKDRAEYAETYSKYRKECFKTAKLEAKVARLQVNKQLNVSTNYSSAYNAKNSRELDTALQDRLELAEETIKTLQTRIEILTLEKQQDLEEFSNILNRNTINTVYNE